VNLRRPRSLGHNPVLPVLAEEKRRDANGILSNQCKLEPVFSSLCYSITHTWNHQFIFSEKYVTKAEFDELKARYEQLEAFVRRYLPITTASTTNAPYYQVGVQQGVSGIIHDPHQSYTPANSSSMVYPSSMMAPPPTPPQATFQHIETPQAPLPPSNRYMKPEGAQSPTRHGHSSSMGLVGPSSSPIMPTLQSPSLARHRVLADSSSASTTAGAKTSPLSLASITSPYHPDLPQSFPKNYNAQTLILGERLRPGSEDPTISTVMIPQAALAAIPAPHQRRYTSTALEHLRQMWRHLPITSVLGSTVSHVGRMTHLRVEKTTGIAA